MHTSRPKSPLKLIEGLWNGFINHSLKQSHAAFFCVAAGCHLKMMTEGKKEGDKRGKDNKEKKKKELEAG